MEDIKFIEEKQLEDGSWLYTFECSEELYDTLVEIYGDNFEDKLSKDFEEYVRERKANETLG